MFHSRIKSELPIAPPRLPQSYRGSGKLRDQVAMITGGESGLGRGVAEIFAREGADVALIFLPEERLAAETTAQAVRAQGRRALLIPGDVKEARFCSDAIQSCVTEFGRLDVLVNNAVYERHRAGLEELSLEQWDETFQSNIHGYFNLARAALPHLQPGAAVVQTGSITGPESSQDRLDYSAMKGALHAFTKSLARLLEPNGIRVGCVAPGPEWTPLEHDENPSEDFLDFGADVPMSRLAQPEVLAPAFVAFAASTDSAYATGDVLALHGNYTKAG